MIGGAGNDRIYGNTGVDHLIGGSGNDILVGGVGSDRVEGGPGNDTLAVIERGNTGDYDLLLGDGGDDTYRFNGEWGVGSVVEDSSNGTDTIDLSGSSQNYVHILSDGRLFSTTGTLYGSQINATDGSVIKLGTVLEDLTGTTRSPGEVLTQWGFAFHQTAEGDQDLINPNPDAILTALGAPTAPTGNVYGALNFLLLVDRGDGETIYDVTVAGGTYPGVVSAGNALTTGLLAAVQTKGYTTLAEAGLSVDVSGGKLRITATARGIPENAFIRTNIIPARLQFAVNAPNTVVSGKGSFENIEHLALGEGGATFVFGNDYWKSSSGLLGTIGASIPLVQSANPAGKLEINTQALHDDSAPLVLDFRAVNHELRFTFSKTADPDVVELTVRSVRDLTLPIIDMGPEIRDDVIVFTHIDKNAIIFGGRYQNTFDFDKGADYQGQLIGGEGYGLVGVLAGRTTDQLRDVLAVVESTTFGLSASDLAGVVYQVENTLNYSAFGSLSPSDYLTTVNLEVLKTGGAEKTATQIALQALAGNFAPLTIDKIDYLRKTTGLTGLGQNLSDANLGEVRVTSGINIVRGTDYAFSDVASFSANPTALLSSGADTITVGGPGLHFLFGGSGADTYRFDTLGVPWGGALIVDDLFQPGLSLGNTADAIADALIPHDTLDFSKQSGDLYYTVFELSTNDIKAVQNYGKEQGLPADFPIELGATAVLVTPFSVYGTTSQPFSFSSVWDSIKTLSFAPRFALAIGVENISGSRGANTFTFYDGAQIGGRIEPGFGGSVTLDYSQYHGSVNSDTDGINADFDASGIDFEVIPSLPDILQSVGLGTITLPSWAQSMFPNVTWQYGSADGSGGGVLGVAVGGNVTGNSVRRLDQRQHQRQRVHRWCGQ